MMHDTTQSGRPQVRQQAAKVKVKGPGEGSEEALEDAFAAEINTRVVCRQCVGLVNVFPI